MQGVPIWRRKFLLGPIVNEYLCNFHISCLLIHFVYVFESEFSSGIKDVTFVVIYI